MPWLQNENLLVVGLTGGIGSGKSTAGSIISKAGIPVIDTDRVTHDLLNDRNSAMHRKVVELFGEKVLGSTGSINRKKLGEVVFASPHSRQLRALESVLHPAIAQSVTNRLRSLGKAGERIVVLEVPLLVEAGWTQLVDLVVVVDCDEDVQFGRYMERTGADHNEARSRIASQTSREDRRQVANYVLDNSGSISFLEEQTESLVATLNGRWVEKMQGST
jgi:dephospho-CoA kinase